MRVKAVMAAFTGFARRLVALSSGDVYRAYDRLTGQDPGPLRLRRVVLVRFRR